MWFDSTAQITVVRPLTRRTQRILLLVGIVLLLCFFLLYKATLTDSPLVIGDEYYYQSQSTHLYALRSLLEHAPQQLMPNFLYLEVMNYVIRHSYNPYLTVKITNVLFYTLASLFIFFGFL